MVWKVQATQRSFYTRRAWALLELWKSKKQFGVGIKSAIFRDHTSVVQKSTSVSGEHILPSKGFKNLPSKKSTRSSSCLIYSTLKMEAVHPSKTSEDFYWATWYYILKEYFS
jgi:hypothetical protein